MMTYNPPYYARLLENYGFRKSQDLYAFWGHIDMLPKIPAKLEPVAEQIIERYDVRMRPMDTSRFLEEVQDVPVDLQSLAGEHLGIRADVQGRGGSHGGRAAAPDRARAGDVAEVDGQVVGAAFGLPDYNPRIRQIDGRLFPFGLFRLLLRKRPHQADPADFDQRHCRSTSGWAWGWC